MQRDGVVLEVYRWLDDNIVYVKRSDNCKRLAQITLSYVVDVRPVFEVWLGVTRGYCKELV